MVKRNSLILIASIVWIVAGFNVLKIGIDTYAGNTSILNFFLSSVIFLLFWTTVFRKLVKKHVVRIRQYSEDKLLFIKFFDIKSFMIMFIMIVGGITIRTFNLLPDKFIAVFYTGLGAALFLAGIMFGINYLKIRTK